MNNLNLDKFLNIVNEEKVKRGLNSYIPLYPMFRVIDDILYVAVLLTDDKDNVWDMNEHIKAEYWVLLDLGGNILEFNKTSEKDFVMGDLIPKNTENKLKEISKYTVNKQLQYKNYLIEDIKKEELPLQKKLSSILGSDMLIDGEKVNINDYLLANLESDIKTKINELVNLLVESKYGSITFYYDNLFKQLVDNKVVDNDKLKLCAEIMNNYYDGVIGIDNLFNLGD